MALPMTTDTLEVEFEPRFEVAIAPAEAAVELRKPEFPTTVGRNSEPEFEKFVAVAILLRLRMTLLYLRIAQAGT